MTTQKMNAVEIENRIMTEFIRDLNVNKPYLDLQNLLKLLTSIGYDSVDNPVFQLALLNLEKSKKIYILKLDTRYILLHENVVELLAQKTKESPMSSPYTFEIQAIEKAKSDFIKME